MTKARIRVICFLCVLAALSPLALAASVTAEETEEKAIEMAVLDVRVTGDIDPRRVEGISTLLAVEASRHPRIEVRSSSDIRAILGFEAEKQLLGCEDDGACMADLAGALGVDYILTSELTRIGDTFVLTLNLLDPATGRARSRANQRVQREADLIDAADIALREVLMVFGAVEPAAPPRHSRSKRQPNWAAWGVGGAGAGASAIGGVMLLSAWQTYWASEGDGARDVTMAEIDSARRVRAPLGVGLMVGGAALVTGAFLVPRPAGGSAVASVGVIDDGVMAALTFPIP